MTSTAEALSGPWAANLPGWLLTAVPASLLVVVQEIATPLPHAGWIVASVLGQLVVVAGWTALVAGVSRRRHGRVVPAASGLLWVGTGVGRGLTGGAVAAAAGADPEWVYRVAFWTIVTLCWMPLLTYALAQWDAHRRLLALRAGLAESLRAAAEGAAEDADARADRLAAVAGSAFRPALDGIRAALRESGSSLDPGTAAGIARRLDDLAVRAAAYTAQASVLPPTAPTVRVSVAEASHDFELRRPVFAALLTAAATVPLLVPDAYREGGPTHAAELLVAMAVSTLLLMGSFAVLRPLGLSGRLRSGLSRAGVLLSGLAGSGVLSVLSWHPEEPRDLVTLVVYPFVVVAAASTIATAVALDAANASLSTQIATARAALADVAERVAAAELDAAARLETLLRGELNGRLASCAMALRFLGADDVAAEARASTLESVVAQLDAAATELHAG